MVGIGLFYSHRRESAEAWIVPPHRPLLGPFCWLALAVGGSADLCWLRTSLFTSPDQAVLQVLRIYQRKGWIALAHSVVDGGVVGGLADDINCQARTKASGILSFREDRRARSKAKSQSRRACLILRLVDSLGGRAPFVSRACSGVPTPERGSRVPLGLTVAATFRSLFTGEGRDHCTTLPAEMCGGGL